MRVADLIVSLRLVIGGKVILIEMTGSGILTLELAIGFGTIWTVYVRRIMNTKVVECALNEDI